jgi:hypothetical protein
LRGLAPFGEALKEPLAGNRLRKPNKIYPDDLREQAGRGAGRNPDWNHTAFQPLWIAREGRRPLGMGEFRM